MALFVLQNDFYAIEMAVNFGVPTEIRTPVTGVKGPCPRPLDDGDILAPFFTGCALYIVKIIMSSVASKKISRNLNKIKMK